MKKLVFPFVILLFVLVACDKTTTDPVADTLYVKFENASTSDYTITVIETRSRGISNGTDQPVGEWGSNLLNGGLTLAPGASTFFTLDIPNLHWSEYRIGVDNGGTLVMVQENENAGVASGYPITHWGGDDRTVSITVRYDPNSDSIYVSGWSDWVGIDE
ncbi:MAG: hypothetical protein J7J72_08165 [Bacteroidales bacterium]|nr:hypothetical protein [Bacteroidales bacterium]